MSVFRFILSGPESVCLFVELKKDLVVYPTDKSLVLVVFAKTNVSLLLWVF